MQKFKKGDLVNIGPLPQMMSSFTTGCRAVVMHSYSDKYSGSNDHEYCIHTETEGQISWYPEDVLTFVESDRLDLVEEWEAADKKEEQRRRSILKNHPAGPGFTMREGDKSCHLKQDKFGGCEAYDHFAIVVHKDNLSEFLNEHNYTMSDEETKLVDKEAKTDVIAIFDKDAEDATLALIVWSPPDSDALLVSRINPYTIAPRTLQSLVVNLYT